MASKITPEVRPEKACWRVDHFVENYTKREQVGACVQLLAAHLFRRHVCDSAQSKPGLVSDSWDIEEMGCDQAPTAFAEKPVQRCALSQTEIEYFGLITRCDKNVGGLDVAVHDAAGVRCVQGIGNLDAQVEHGQEFCAGPL